MAGTSLTTDATTTGATSYATASITPTASRLLIATVGASIASAPVPTPTVSGNGLTWELVENTDNTGSEIRSLFVFRALSGASPSAGAVTFNFGSTMSGCVWNVTEYDNYDTSGTNGSGAIAQSFGRVLSSSNSVAENFDTAVTASSQTHGAVQYAAQENATAGSGWTLLGTDFVGAPSNGFAAVTSTTTAQNTVSISWTTNGARYVVGVEILAAGGTPPTTVQPTEISTSEALGAPTISTTIATAPDGIVTSEALGEPQLIIGGDVSPDEIPSGEALGDPSITATITLAPDAIESGEALGDPEVAAFTTAIEVEGIDDPTELGTPTITAQAKYMYFTPPYVIHNHQIEGALIGSLHYGVSVFLLDGTWQSAEYPTVEQENESTYFFRGGHRYEVTEAEAAALVAEGYTITTEYR